VKSSENSFHLYPYAWQSRGVIKAEMPCNIAGCQLFIFLSQTNASVQGVYKYCTNLQEVVVMENVKAFKDLFEFPLLKLSDEGRFLSGKRSSETFVDVTESVLNTPIISVGLKSQYLYMEGDTFKASPIKQQFSPEEKAKYKSLKGKNKRYRMIYVPATKSTYIFTYTNGIGESFYVSDIGISDAFKIVGVERRTTIHAKSSKMGVKFYAPILEKLQDVALDEQDKATIKELKSYFEPFKSLETKTTDVVETPEVSF